MVHRGTTICAGGVLRDERSTRAQAARQQNALLMLTGTPNVDYCDYLCSRRWLVSHNAATPRDRVRQCCVFSHPTLTTAAAGPRQPDDAYSKLQSMTEFKIKQHYGRTACLFCLTTQCMAAPLISGHTACMAALSGAILDLVRLHADRRLPGVHCIKFTAQISF
jgi:hypothetical protein